MRSNCSIACFDLVSTAAVIAERFLIRSLKI